MFPPHGPCRIVLNITLQNCSAGNSLLEASVADHSGKPLCIKYVIVQVLIKFDLGPYLGNVSFGGKFCPL